MVHSSVVQTSALIDPILHTASEFKKLFLEKIALRRKSSNEKVAEAMQQKAKMDRNAIKYGRQEHHNERPVSLRSFVFSRFTTYRLLVSLKLFGTLIKPNWYVTTDPRGVRWIKAAHPSVAKVSFPTGRATLTAGRVAWSATGLTLALSTALLNFDGHVEVMTDCRSA